MAHVINDRWAAHKLVYDFITQYMPVSGKDFSRIEKYWILRSFPRRSRIIDEGQTEDYFNIIISGFTRKFALAEKKEKTRQLAMEGDAVFAEASFITGQPSRVIIETLEETGLISIHKFYVKKLFQELPEMERLGRLVLTDMFVRKDRWDYNNLSTSVRERFLNYMKQNPHVLQRVPQKYIASYLSIKPETFSRLKHLIQKKKKG